MNGLGVLMGDNCCFFVGFCFLLLDEIMEFEDLEYRVNCIRFFYKEYFEDFVVDRLFMLFMF